MNTSPAQFENAARRFPDRVALVDEDDDRPITYAELDRLRRQAAAALIAHDVQAGDRVAIWAPNCVQWVVAALGIHSAGAVLVPVNTRLRGAEVGDILNRSHARLLFCAGHFLGEHYPSLLGAHAPPCLEQIVVLHDAARDDLTWTRFLEAADAELQTAVDERLAALRPDSVMDIMFTSGTTGRPKGVITTHEQNLRVIDEWSQRMGLSPRDRYLVVNPFFHAFGYKVGWLAGLLRGVELYPHAVFDAGKVLERVAAKRISVLPGPPTLFISMLDALESQDIDLSSLRATITGAASVAPSLIERIRSQLGFKVVLTGYGLTETCGIATLCDPDDSAETIVRSCGRAIPHTEVACMNDEGALLGPGETGEVVIRGYNVMQGYLDDPLETAKTIDLSGWLHTGDVGHLDEHGYLTITDRLKDMYITGGFNCYPAEIERLIAAHPDVAQIAVVGIPDARMGEVGMAFVVPRSGHSVDEAAFIAWCREHMANYKVPRRVAVRDSLPMNASGKVLKYQLRTEAG